MTASRPALALLGFLAACSSQPAGGPGASASAGGSASARPPETAPVAAARLAARVREGGTLRLAELEGALYLADEDHGVVRRISVPVDARSPALDLPMPGPPAQVLPLDGFVLVTVRDPGLLVVLRTTDDGPVEVARVPLPGDAWGLAVTPDERTALVTSAWTSRVSAVDLATLRVRWTAAVPREPRGVVVRGDGRSAYVSHLVGAALTRIDGVDGDAPAVRAVELPPAPLGAPVRGSKLGFDLDASLGYAPVLSPDGGRLFVPRHALGAFGVESWWGRPTVDVLLTEDETSLAPPRVHPGRLWVGAQSIGGQDVTVSSDGQVPLQRVAPFVQPRAAVYREATHTLLVAGEGNDRLAELDARALDPSLRAARVYDLGGPRDPARPGETRCGAPSGLALSADEGIAYVSCRSTDDLAIVRLDPYRRDAPFEEAIERVHLSERAPLDAGELGKRLFYDARDVVMSDGLSCAGCHPEGRDDGHVWHEHPPKEEDGEANGGLTAAPIFRTSFGLEKGYFRGVPRQTPMLAGRVAARGPYGWQSKAPLLEQRIIVGFGVHRWLPGVREVLLRQPLPRAEALAGFLRQGLRTPPVERRALSEEERLGERLFSSDATQCAKCHFPWTEFTDRRRADVLGALVRPTFEDEPERAFKTPSLLFVGGTAPYFHDGRAATLEALVDGNRDRMGKTEHLSKTERAALVAYLKTLGVVAPPEGSAADAGPAAVGVVVPPLPVSAVEARRAPAPAAPFVETPPPTWPDWSAARPVERPRPARACELYRIREWFRVHCEAADPMLVAQITQLAGSAAGVEVTQGRHGRGVDVVFSMRPGDRRVFELDELVSRTRYSVFWEGTVVVTATWLSGEREPTVVVLD